MYKEESGHQILFCSITNNHFPSLCIIIVVSFDLSENDYRANEFELSIPVKISKSSGTTLANPVVMRVTPMTVERALMMNIISPDVIEEDSPISPNRASE